MLEYGILIFLIISLYHLIGKKDRKLYIFIITFVFLIMLALRSETMGLNDVESVYRVRFETIRDTSWGILTSLSDSYTGSSLLFTIFTKLISMFVDYRGYLIVVAIISLVPISILIYKYSENPMISFLLFFLYFFVYYIYLLRYVASIGISVIALLYLLKGKKITFYILTIIAAFIHLTSVILLISYIIFKPFSKMSKSVLLSVFLGLSLIIFFFGKNIFLVALSVLPSFYSSNFSTFVYRPGNLGLMILGINVMVFLLAIMFLDYKKYANRIYIYFCGISIICIVMMTVLEEFYRLSLVFSLSWLIILPRVLSRMKKNYIDNIVSIGVLVVFFAFFIYLLIGNNAFPYRYMF